MSKLACRKAPAAQRQTACQHPMVGSYPILPSRDQCLGRLCLTVPEARRVLSHALHRS